MCTIRCCRTKIHSASFLVSTHIYPHPQGIITPMYFARHQKKVKHLKKQGAYNIFLPRQAEQNDKFNTDVSGGAFIPHNSGEPPLPTAVRAEPMKNF